MPSYTHVSSGTPATLNTSGAISPTGSSVVSGNLLLLVTGCRAASATVDSAPSGWTQLDIQTTNTSIAIYARVADGTSSDNPSITWSGTAYRYGWVEQFSGNVYSTLASIVDKAETEGSSSTTTLLAPSMTAPSSANCLMVLFSAKQKSTTGNSSTFTPATEFTERRELCEDGVRVAAGFASWQQTTATAFDGDNWTKDTGTDDALAGRSILLALKTAALTKKLKLKALSSAASASSVEGVVLNATRDTVIGEFTAQTFEAALESGEAVLKVSTADISPNGGTLTTSDTPLAIAYNATYTTPLVSCTVIEE